MRTSATASLLAAIAGLATAQYVIDPNNVPQSTRDNWCTSQKTQCPLICLQYPNTYGANSNECDSKSLTFSCVCSNGITPNVSEYSQTLPYFICTEWGNECEKNCGRDNTCAASCRQNHPCGAQNPTRVNTTSSSSVPTASKTGGIAGVTSVSAGETNAVVYTGLAGATTTPTGAAARMQPAALQFGQLYGLFVVAGGLFAGFALLL